MIMVTWTQWKWTKGIMAHFGLSRNFFTTRTRWDSNMSWKHITPLFDPIVHWSGGVFRIPQLHDVISVTLNLDNSSWYCEGQPPESSSRAEPVMGLGSAPLLWSGEGKTYFANDLRGTIPGSRSTVKKVMWPKEHMLVYLQGSGTEGVLEGPVQWLQTVSQKGNSRLSHYPALPLSSLISGAGDRSSNHFNMET